MKHFKLTDETMVNIFGIKLFRLELTIDCKWGKYGDKGGWVESESLSNGDARVYGNARVSGDAWKKSPLQIQGTKHFINFCAKGILRIGCKEKTLKEWKKEFKGEGINNSYTKEEILEYELYINLAIKINKLYEK